MRKNCPLKGAGADGGRRGDDAQGGGAPRVRNVASSPQVGADGKRDDGTLPQAAGPSPTAPSGSASASASVDSTQSGAGAPATSSASPKDMDDFIKSAAQVLKMMTEQHANTQANPSMKMLKKVVAEYEQKMALVDSGATHPLRRAATATEWVESPEVEALGNFVDSAYYNGAVYFADDPPGRQLGECAGLRAKVVQTPLYTSGTGWQRDSSEDLYGMPGS